jgi:hypothetical protein
MRSDGPQIDYARGADLRARPPGLSSDYPTPRWASHRDACREIAGRVKPNKMRLNIMSALATGWLPWGVQWFSGKEPALSWIKSTDWPKSDGTSHRLPGRFALCCGHTLRPKVAQEFIDAGLLEAGPPVEGVPSLIITEAGRVWLSENWN